MKRQYRSIPNDDKRHPKPDSYVQDDVYWPVDRWDDELAKVQPILDVADEYRILRMPSMGQAVKHGDDKSPGTLCGPTSASMVYNFWQLCQYPEEPEAHYIKMTNSGGWNLRDTSGKTIPFANFATVGRSAKGIGYLDANFGDPPSILTSKSEHWIQDQCKLIVDSIKFKCPVVLYSRLSVTGAHQHIVTVSGYAKLAGELWLLILDPESLSKTGQRVAKGMYSLAQVGTTASRADLKTINASHNTICLLEGKFEEALGSIYFLKASHLFAAHCIDSGYYNYQNKDAKKVGHYIHHGHKAPSITVPDELVVTSGAPKVTVPVPVLAHLNFSDLVGNLVSSFPFGAGGSKTGPTSAAPAAKPAGQPLSFSKLFELGRERASQIRDNVAHRIDETIADLKSSRLTLQPYQGYFPLGMQGSWHGGIHLATGSDGTIHCCRDGVIVAARLPDKDPANPKHGSRNFVLVRHQTPDDQPYWSLYMHLRPTALSPGDMGLQAAFPWLFKMTLTKIDSAATVMRAEAGTHAAKVRDVAVGESFAVLETKVVDKMTWHHVHSPKDDTIGWIAKTERVKCEMGIPELEQLKKGDVVVLERPVKFGTCLGLADLECRAGNVLYFHWEIFSKDPLPGDWQKVCDTETADRQWINDPDLMRKILNRNKMGSYSEALTPGVVAKSFNEPPDENGKILRGCACQFVSEWSIDWSKAVDEAKVDPAQKDTVIKEFQPYSFWKEAVAAGAKDLPSDAKIWHYNPREVLNRLHPVVAGPNEKTPPELADALKTKWIDPQGIPYTNQNDHDLYIQLAAMNHALPPLLLKSLVAQESKFKAKASNSQGYAGLTQLGLREAQNHGLNTGATSKSSGEWVYDPSDERFEPAKALNAGATYYVEGREAADKLIFQHFEDEVAEDQYDKFGLAIYNLGQGTLSNAHRHAREAGKTDATWEELIEGGTDSFLCQGMPDSFNKAAKHKEGTEFVAQILSRMVQAG